MRQRVRPVNMCAASPRRRVATLAARARSTSYELYYFLFKELPPDVSNNIAHSAHLGGMLGGWLFFKYALGRGPILKGARPKIKLPQWLKKRRPNAKTYGSFSLNIDNRQIVKEEVDRILDKINSEGFGSLNEEEKRILDSAKDLLNR